MVGMLGSYLLKALKSFGKGLGVNGYPEVVMAVLVN